MLSDVRPPEACSPTERRGQDREYKREGTCSFFLHLAPHGGWRHVEVTRRRTAPDLACEPRAMADVDFPGPRASGLVQDNPDVHTQACCISRLYPDLPS